MKSYSSHLAAEMKEIEGKPLTTPQGNQVVFRFELIPADMKWMASHSGELNNCATYFSSFANVNQSNKATIGGTIGGPKQTWQTWDYEQRLKVAEKVDKYKKHLRDPTGKQRRCYKIYCPKQITPRMCASFRQVCRFVQIRAFT